VSRSRLPVIAAGVVIVAVLGFLLVRGLGNATMYFRTADEAIAHRQEIGDKRFRIEGIVAQNSLHQDGTNTDFDIISKGVTVAVENKAQTQGIFREGIPVVLEGRFSHGTNTFVSDRIMVKHDSTYTEQHPERVSGSVNS
jgi:cytochrome c-type biogenesis protein CcmE